MPVGTGVSSWYRCWHHGPVTLALALGDLGFVLLLELGGNLVY